MRPGLLRPSSDAGAVAERQALTAEAVALLDHAAEPSFAGIADVREATDRVARGGTLGAGESFTRPRGLRSGPGSRPGVRSASRRQRAACSCDCSSLSRRRSRPSPTRSTELSRTTARACVIRVAVAAPAPPGLRSGRSASRRKPTRRPFRRVREHLQESFVTERAGRPVLAVAPPARSRAGHRPRVVEHRADAVRRAVRDRRAEQPAEGPRAPRARRGADPRASSRRRSARRARARAASTPGVSTRRAPRAARSAAGAEPVETAISHALGARHPLLDPARQSRTTSSSGAGA